jgi:hypothetical protein
MHANPSSCRRLGRVSVKIRRLRVVSEGKLAGVVSRSGICRAVLNG